MNTYNTFSKLIDNNERILWYGKEYSNKSGLIAVIIPVLWFIVSILVLIPIAKISFKLLVFAIPFCIVEAIFIEMADRLAPRKEYCITDLRLIIKKGSKLKIKNLIEVKAITLERITENRGSLVFEEPYKDGKASYGDFRFYNIDGYVTVYKIASDARDKQRKLAKGE